MKTSTTGKIKLKVNTEAYERLEEFRFGVIEVLSIFGEEVWENNNELKDRFTAREVRDAFMLLMLEETRYRANPDIFEPVFC
jgi:hypothetical protein